MTVLCLKIVYWNLFGISDLCFENSKESTNMDINSTDEFRFFTALRFLWLFVLICGFKHA